MPAYSTPPSLQRGASLMLSWRCANRTILIVGNNTIAASRVLASLEADATVRLVGSSIGMCDDLEHRIARGEVDWHDRWFDPDQDLDSSVSLAFICVRDDAACAAAAAACRARRIPVNVADRPELCDFFSTSVYRDGPVQVAVSTNGNASQLAVRIRRHIAASLPRGLGTAVKEMGKLRKVIREADPGDEAAARRMRWLAQVCEYWALDRLANLDAAGIESLLHEYRNDEGYASHESDTKAQSQTSLDSALHSSPPSSTSKKGTILLIGTGPGDPSLLTRAAHAALTAPADLILADKLIPSSILSLIPAGAPLHIARKFPGNAPPAQDELNTLALRALSLGHRVLRLKQGDPYLYGRGHEEVLLYRSHGHTVRILPGLTSATVGPLLAGIPLTHRGLASRVLISTAVAAGGADLLPPNFEKQRTDVFFMAVNRLPKLITALVENGYPPSTPIAIVERASCPDQRVLWASLNGIVALLDRVGGARPPGLIIVGGGVEVLMGGGNEGVIEGCDHIFGEEALLGGLGGVGGEVVLGLHDPEGLS